MHTTAGTVLRGSSNQERTTSAKNKLERHSQENKDWDSPGNRQRQPLSTEQNEIGVWPDTFISTCLNPDQGLGPAYLGCAEIMVVK